MYLKIGKRQDASHWWGATLQLLNGFSL